MTILWEDIGGLEKQRKEILDILMLPMEHPELFSSSTRRRRSILFFGPPGKLNKIIFKYIILKLLNI